VEVMGARLLLGVPPMIVVPQESAPTFL